MSITLSAYYLLGEPYLRCWPTDEVVLMGATQFPPTNCSALHLQLFSKCPTFSATPLPVRDGYTVDFMAEFTNLWNLTSCCQGERSDSGARHKLLLNPDFLSLVNRHSKIKTPVLGWSIPVIGVNS